jgi:threonine synthase
MTSTCSAQVEDAGRTEDLYSLQRFALGPAIAVPDAALVAGALRLARDEGILACPEGGACLAALEILVAQGDVRRD